MPQRKRSSVIYVFATLVLPSYRFPISSGNGELSLRGICPRVRRFWGHVHHQCNLVIYPPTGPLGTLYGIPVYFFWHHHKLCICSKEMTKCCLKSLVLRGWGSTRKSASTQQSSKRKNTDNVVVHDTKQRRLCFLGVLWTSSVASFGRVSLADLKNSSKKSFDLFMSAKTDVMTWFQWSAGFRGRYQVRNTQITRTPGSGVDGYRRMLRKVTTKSEVATGATSAGGVMKVQHLG